ncbi:GreA/GreB family elongation factor [Alkalihalobacillus sp. AL-G]|uniref:GreA/GreB family elongation factor n=1 Tax=Alkalihalobacillus sp. AL-G TaxID=2926399 RepID=UPI00272D7158|nr:GreA/GreB family elongation factor [Alkalihalobacillus sp. AL-G]WLD93492.1 GreA/GreB family elongation factor [Alkalihalobacillus sp. AL-G]
MSVNSPQLTSEGIKTLATELLDVYDRRNKPLFNTAEMHKQEGEFSVKRIGELEHLLYSAELLSGQRTETISLGSTVMLLDIFLDEVDTYRLVHPVEASPITRKLSIESALGKELLLKEKGDMVTVHLHGTRIRYQIIDVI